MGATDPGSAREEAERLVATALAAMRLATSDSTLGGGLGQIGDAISGVLGRAGGQAYGPGPAQGSGRASGPDADAGSEAADHGRRGFATGSAECCVCPVCRAVTTLRDPSPEFAERLATGAGDFAAGVASLLRSLSAPVGRPAGPGPAAGSTPAADTASVSDPGPGPEPHPVTEPGPGSQAGPCSEPEPAPGPEARSAPAPAPRPVPGDEPYPDGDPPSGPSSQDDEVWRAAARTGHDSWPAQRPDVWAVATRAEARITPADATGPADPAGKPAAPRSTGGKPMARKAVKQRRIPGDEA